MSGVSLVVDRYAFSGVAFTAAKQVASMEWCKSPDIGLPAPDIVFYLDLPAGAAQERHEYGSERYETAEFQALVKEQFTAMMENSWKLVNAARTIDSIHIEVLESAKEVIEQQAYKPIKLLWTE
jgi:dTMP kinase